MNCHEARNWMSPYLDSELGQTKTFEVSEHLRRCSDCANRFAAEQAVDDAMRARLHSPAMPPELWSGLRRDLTAPSWVRRLGARPGLAVAACLAVAALSTVVILRPRPERPAARWLARRLAAQTPDNSPFLPLQSDRNVIDALVRDQYGLRFATAAAVAALGHHDFQLVSAARRTDAAGRAYIEVHLNCCGQPVIVALARPTNGTLPAPLAATAAASSTHASENWQVDGMYVARRIFAGVHVMAASRHPVRHILDTMSLVKT